MPIQQMLLGAGAAAKKTYVDDVFSTYLWKATNANRSINVGFDYTSDEGLVWIKNRGGGDPHVLFDTIRGANKRLSSSSNAVENTSITNELKSFTSTGYNLGDAGTVNGNDTFSSWNFKSAPGFFDVVTYTGNGSARTIAHSLDSVPGMMFVKKTSGSEDWTVYHKSLGNDWLYLNTRDTKQSGGAAPWNNTTPTASVFSIGSHNLVNEDGEDYIAYLFADDSQSFGEDENASVIKCGTFQGPTATPNIGFEPQWILLKGLQNNTDWIIYDSMRGIPWDGTPQEIYPNKTNAEAIGGNFSGLRPDADGMRLGSGYNAQYIYCAIRRPDGIVGKPADAGTDVFAMDTGAGNNYIPNYDSNFPVDFAIHRIVASTENWESGSRLTQGKSQRINSGRDEANSSEHTFDSNVGWNSSSSSDSDFQSWMWKRHAGFDVCCYFGSGSADYVYHSLGKVPEMIWVKRRTGTDTDWRVYHKGLGTTNDPFDYSLKLNSDIAQYNDATIWNDAAPEINRFTVGTNAAVNSSAVPYLSMLFASVDGISKVGSFDGSDSAQTIDFGFQPRFLIIKCYTHGYGWFVLDTLRGITAGSNTDDKYLELEDTHPNYEHTFGAVTSTGFTFDGNQNTSNDAGKSYIYYAHA